MLSIGVTGHNAQAGGLHRGTVPWVPRLPETVHSLENPEVRGYRPSKILGLWQVRSIRSISPATRALVHEHTGGEGGSKAKQQHRHKQEQGLGVAPQQTSNKRSKALAQYKSTFGRIARHVLLLPRRPPSHRQAIATPRQVPLNYTPPSPHRLHVQHELNIYVVQGFCASSWPKVYCMVWAGAHGAHLAHESSWGLLLFVDLDTKCSLNSKQLAPAAPDVNILSKATFFRSSWG